MFIQNELKSITLKKEIKDENDSITANIVFDKKFLGWNIEKMG